MSIAFDASTPGVTGGANTGFAYVTSSFTPPAGSLLVAVQAATSFNINQATTGISDSLSGTWTTAATWNGGSSWAAMAVYLRQIGSSAAMTVSMAANSNPGLSNMKVYVLTGAAPLASALGNVFQAPTTPDTMTAMAAGSAIVAPLVHADNSNLVANDGNWGNDGGAHNSSGFAGGPGGVQAGHATALTSAPGATLSLGWHPTTGGAQLMVEILAPQPPQVYVGKLAHA